MRKLNVNSRMSKRRK